MANGNESQSSTQLSKFLPLRLLARVNCMDGHILRWAQGKLDSSLGSCIQNYWSLWASLCNLCFSQLGNCLGNRCRWIDWFLFFTGNSPMVGVSTVRSSGCPGNVSFSALGWIGSGCTHSCKRRITLTWWIWIGRRGKWSCLFEISLPKRALE